MRVYVESVGCRLNQSEIETLARQFRALGHELVHDAAEADLCVVNTCAVTSEAARSSRTMIRRLHREGPQAEIVATGCYAHLAPQQVGALEGVARVVDNEAKDRLVALVTGADVPAELYEREPLMREFMPGALGRTRAFVKVQDGCNNRCTFCVTTLARGKARSRPQVEIVREIRALVALDYREVVLTGVNLSSYGHDWKDRDGLAKLVRAILDETDVPRLRLSSLEPWNLSAEFFALWDDPRMCRHLHLPLQSGCDATLRRMVRRTSRAEFRALVEAARARIPEVAISTDIIVGFPGETEAEFEESYAFAREMDFMKLHVFRYSPREGTVAARLPQRVPPDVAKARSARMLALSEEGARRYWTRFLGCEVDVLWEQVSGASAAGFHNVGLTDTYIRVEMDAPQALTNAITRVRLVALSERGMRAVALAERAETP